MWSVLQLFNFDVEGLQEGCTNAEANRFTVKFWLNLQMMVQYCLPSLALLFLVRYLFKAIPQLRSVQRPLVRRVGQFVSRRFIAAIGVWLDMFYLTLVTLGFKSTLCHRVGADLVLFAQDSVRCYSRQHLHVFIAGVFVLCMLTLAYPWAWYRYNILVMA